jgi:hypothetical protein
MRDTVARLSSKEFDRLLFSRSEAEWTEVCHQIKSRRGGKYPPDWYARVLQAGVLESASRGWRARRKRQETRDDRAPRLVLRRIVGGVDIDADDDTDPLTSRTEPPVKIPTPAEIAARCPQCLLCGRRPSYAGYWIVAGPAARLLNVPPGKSRVIAYMLCKSCQRKGDVQRRIEAKIIGETQVIAGNPAAN